MTLAETIFEDFRRGKIESFYTHIYPDLLVYATNLLHGDSAIRAEDCVQDAVEVSYLRRMEFISGRQWMAFVLTCIRNRAISFLRHEEAQNNYLTHMKMELSSFKDAYHDYIELETKTRLYNAIASLPEDLKQIFNLSFELGLRNPEIAAWLSVAEITVKKRKAKLIRSLRTLLSDEDSSFLIFFLLAA